MIGVGTVVATAGYLGQLYIWGPCFATTNKQIFIAG